MRLAPDKAVEIVLAQTCRPAIERANNARFLIRHVMDLAQPGGVIAVFAQDSGDRGRRRRNHRGLAGEACRPFGKETGSAVVMVAAGQQRRTRRTADSRRMEAIVAQPVFGQLVQRWRGHRSAECADLPEAHIVDQDDDHVGRPFKKTTLRPDSINHSQFNNSLLIIDPRQPAQAEASPAERSDLLRQLVPGLWSASFSPAANGDPAAVMETATTVHDPHPNSLPIPDDNLSSTGRIKDANADFFD